MDPILTSVALYVADKLVAQFIKEEGYSKIKDFVQAKDSYTKHLQNVIFDTIVDYKSKFSRPQENGQIEFYESEVCFEKLSKYILFNDDTSLISTEDFSQDKRIRIPAKEELEAFYTFFADRIKADKELEKLRVEDGYKRKVFDIDISLRVIQKALVQISSQMEGMKGQLSRIEGMLSQGNPVVAQSSFIEDLEFPKELMTSNNHQQALSFLENFKKNKWELINSELKYKVLANIGICKLNLNEEQEAGRYLTEALEYDPENPKALGFAALGYSMLDDESNARKFAEKSIAKEPQNSNAWVALLEIISNKEQFENVITRIPDSLKKNSTISYALFKQYKNYGERAKAEEVLRDCLQNGEREPHILASLGTHLLEEIKDPLLLKTQQLSSDFQQKVKDGIELLSEAIEKVKGKDISKYRWWWYVNRGIAKKFVNDNSGALDDIKQAYELNPNEYFTIRHLAISLTENNNYPEAQRHFERLKELDTKDELIDIAICECLIHTGDSNEAEDRLSKLFIGASDVRIKQEAISLLIKLKSRNGKISDAIDLAKTELSKDENNIIAYLDLFFALIEGKNVEEARQSLNKAYSLVAKDTENRIVFELAERFFQINEFEKAADLYSRIADESLFTPLNQRLLHSYVNSGNLGKTLELARKIIAENGLLPEVVEIESYVYETSGDLNSAILICENCLAVNPDCYPIIARLANLYFRVRDNSKLSKTLELIADYSKFPIHLQFRLAYLNGSIGKTELAMEIAYNARRNDFSNGPSHLSFINLSLELKPDWDKLLHLQEVSQDSTVTVVDEGGNLLIFTILTDEMVYLERGERYIDDKLSQLMLGKKVGEQFEIEQGFGKPKTFTIQGIVHKFVSASRESFELLGTKFITTKGVTIFDLKKDVEDVSERLKPITEIIDGGYEFDEQLYEYYKSGSLPIGSIASFRKQNPIEVWGWLISRDFGLISAASIPNEYLISTQKLSTDKNLLLDITSILTLAELDLLDSLNELGIELTVSNSTVDILREEIVQCEGKGENGFISVGKFNGQYFKHEVTKEIIDKNLNHLKKILAWVENRCKILPCERIISFSEKDREHYYKLLGDSFFETALIAQDKNAIVLSDDGVYRSYLFQEHKVNGISTASLLYYLHIAGKLDFARFNKAIVRLYALGYAGLYINSEILWLGFDESKFSMKRPFTSILPMLTGNVGTDGRVIIKTVGDFLYNLYTRIHVHETQDFICNVVVQHAIINRDAIFIGVLAQYLKRKFVLLPKEYERILLNIYQLIRGKIL